MAQKSKLSLFWDSQKGCNGAACDQLTRRGLRETADGWIVGGTSSTVPDS